VFGTAVLAAAAVPGKHCTSSGLWQQQQSFLASTNKANIFS